LSSSLSSPSSLSTSVVASSPPPRPLPSFTLQQQLPSAPASCCFVHPSIQPHFHDSLSSVDCNLPGRPTDSTHGVTFVALTLNPPPLFPFSHHLSPPSFTLPSQHHRQLIVMF
jgi:hypothetical protein